MMKRTFTKEDKLLIIKEASGQGVAPPLERHGVYPALYYPEKNNMSRWAKRASIMG